MLTQLLIRIGSMFTPIYHDHEIGIDIDDVVQIVIDTDTQTVVEEINHVKVASQPLRSWFTCWSFCSRQKID